MIKAKEFYKKSKIWAKNLFTRCYRLSQNTLSLLIILGLLIRYCLGLYTADPWDVSTVWYPFALNVIHGLGVYDRRGFAYPPVWGYILGASAKLGALIFEPAEFAAFSPALEKLSLMPGLSLFNATVVSPLFNLILKTPLFIADLLIAFLLYRFVNDLVQDKKEAHARAMLAFSLWFFNPLVVMVSALTGNFDTLSSLFALLAVILCYQRNFFWSGLMLGIGFMCKAYPIYLTPLFLATMMSIKYHEVSFNIIAAFKKSFGNILVFTCGGAIGIIVTTLPFLLSRNLNTFLSVPPWGRITIGVPSPGEISFWNIAGTVRYGWITVWAAEHPALMELGSFLAAGCLLAWLAIVILFVGFKDPKKALVYGSVFTFCIMFLTNYRVSPRYLVWMMPFLVLAISLFKEYKREYVLITFCSVFLYFSVQGLLAQFGPLAVYTSILRSEALAEIYLTYWYIPGLIFTYLREDIYVITGYAGVIGIILCLFPRSISKLKILRSVIRRGRTNEG